MSERKVNLEAILSEIFQPIPQECSSPTKDLQLAITLNPDLNIIKTAMKEACKQTLELAAENAKTKDIDGGWQGCETTYTIVDKQSILNTINQIE